MQKTNFDQNDFDIRTAGPVEKARYFSKAFETLKQTSPQIDPSTLLANVLYILSDKSTPSAMAEIGLRIIDRVVEKCAPSKGELPKSLEQNIRLSLEAGISFSDYRIQEIAFRSLEAVASRLEITEALGQKVANLVTANWDVEQRLAEDALKMWRAMAVRNPALENFGPVISQRPGRENYAAIDAGYLTAKLA